MIEVKNLSKTYGDFQAVKNISFTVKKGQIVGLLGPNGAGKSTTMNMMTGYISATSGEVKINGYDILDEPIKAKQQLGYLPEIPPLYKDMTVMEYLNFVKELKYKKTLGTEAVDEVIKALKLQDVKQVLIKKLSKGYQQRVGLAQALIGNPPLLILDEPMVGLDPEQTIEMRQLIKGLGKEHTIILSSHILSEISEICDHIIIINNGKVTAEDTTEELTEKNSNKQLIKMVIKGDKQTIQKVLSDSKLVTDITIKEDTEAGVYQVMATSIKNDDIRDDLFTLLVENKLMAYSITNEKLTLEEVFIKLTQNPKGKEEKDAGDKKVKQVPEEKKEEKKPESKKKVLKKKKQKENHVEDKED